LLEDRFPHPARRGHAIAHDGDRSRATTLPGMAVFSSHTRLPLIPLNWLSFTLNRREPARTGAQRPIRSAQMHPYRSAGRRSFPIPKDVYPQDCRQMCG
jgi:hypothetical protein